MEKSNKMEPVKWIFMQEKLIKNIELRFVFFTSHRMLDQRDHRVHRGEVVVVVDHAESGVVGGVPDLHTDRDSTAEGRASEKTLTP